MAVQLSPAIPGASVFPSPPSSLPLPPTRLGCAVLPPTLRHQPPQREAPRPLYDLTARPQVCSLPGSSRRDFLFQSCPRPQPGSLLVWWLKAFWPPRFPLSPVPSMGPSHTPPLGIIPNLESVCLSPTHSSQEGLRLQGAPRSFSQGPSSASLCLLPSKELSRPHCIWCLSNYSLLNPLSQDSAAPIRPPKPLCRRRQSPRWC